MRKLLLSVAMLLPGALAFQGWEQTPSPDPTASILVYGQPSGSGTLRARSEVPDFNKDTFLVWMDIDGSPTDYASNQGFLILGLTRTNVDVGGGCTLLVNPVGIYRLSNDGNRRQWHMPMVTVTQQNPEYLGQKFVFQFAFKKFDGTWVFSKGFEGTVGWGPTYE